METGCYKNSLELVKNAINTYGDCILKDGYYLSSMCGTKNSETFGNL